MNIRIEYLATAALFGVLIAAYALNWPTFPGL